LKETDIQKAAITQFRKTYPSLCWEFLNEKKVKQKCQWLIASLNGVNLSGKKAFMTINSMKSQGMVSGEADLHLPIPSKGGEFHSLYIELKTKVGVQSKGQKVFQEKAKSIDCDYIICRSVEEVMIAIKEHLGY